MTTITIPKKIIPNQNLIAVPRNLYEEFLAWQKMVKSRKTFKPTPAEKKVILRGRQEISKGEYVTLEELVALIKKNNEKVGYRQFESGEGEGI